MAMTRGGMGKEVAGARLKKRAMGASRQGKKKSMAIMPPEMEMKFKKGGKVKKAFAEGGAVTTLPARAVNPPPAGSPKALGLTRQRPATAKTPLPTNTYSSTTRQYTPAENQQRAVARYQDRIANEAAKQKANAARQAFTAKQDAVREAANAAQKGMNVPGTAANAAKLAGTLKDTRVQTPSLGSMRPGYVAKKKFADGGPVIAGSLPADPRMAARMNRLAARGKFADMRDPNPMNPVTGRPGRGGSPPSGGTMGPGNIRQPGPVSGGNTYADAAAQAYTNKRPMGLKKGGEVKSKMAEADMAGKKKKFATGGAVTGSDKNAGAAMRAARDASFGKQMLGRLQGIVANRGPSPGRTAAITALQKNPNMTPEQLAKARDSAGPKANVPPPQRPSASGGPGSPAVRKLKKGGEVKKMMGGGMASKKMMAMKKGGMAKKGMKKGGMALMIVIGGKKGKK